MSETTRIAIDIPSAPTCLVIERGAVSRLGEALAREAVSVAGRVVEADLDVVEVVHRGRAQEQLRDRLAGADALRLYALVFQPRQPPTPP